MALLLATLALVAATCSQLACARVAAQPIVPQVTDGVDNNPMLHQSGTGIVDGNGTPVRLRGVNLGGWLNLEGYLLGGNVLTSESVVLQRLQQVVGADAVNAWHQQVYDNFITDADIARIAQLGFNVVRVPINDRLLEDDSAPFVYKQSGWDVLDRLLDWCDEYNVYAVLDLHAAPGGQSTLSTADPGPHGQLWDSDGNKSRTVALWQAIAQRYANRSSVAGYDILNEPSPKNPGDLVLLDEQVAAAIRQVDPYHMLIIEGAKLATEFGVFGGPLSANQMYEFHMYTLLGDERQQKIKEYRTLAQQQQVPVWAGEFGESSESVVQSSVQLFEDPNNLVSGWAYWTWKKAPSKYPYLVGIVPSDAWKQTIGWVSEPLKLGKPPSAAVVQQGMQDFAGSIQFANDQENPAMENALLSGWNTGQ